MESELSLRNEEASLVDAAEWCNDAGGDDAAADMPFAIRPSWSVMVAQLAGTAPEPIRIADFGRGSRIISRALSGDQEERDLDLDDDEEDVVPRGRLH